MLSVFVLDIEKLIGLSKDNEIRRRIDSIIDSDRQKKLDKLQKNQTGIAACEGAGLLLQYVAQRYLVGNLEERIYYCEINSILDYVEDRIKQNGKLILEYRIGSEGKPYWTDERLPFFNISHSGKMVTVAVSEAEVGIDIQIKRGKREIDLADRFFHRQEVETVKEDVSLFYRLWARKEAVGKCTGEGVRPYLDFNVLIEPPEYRFFEEEFTRKEDIYFLTACTKNI